MQPECHAHRPPGALPALAHARLQLLFPAVWLCGLILWSGCSAPPTVADPLTRTLAGGGEEQQLEFWHQLADRPVCSNDEAFHGLLLFLDGSDPHESYDARVAALRARGLLPEKFSEPAEAAVRRGTLAVAIARALRLEGGLMYSLAPMCSRYAVRELVYQNLYPQSSPNQTFTGSEFLGIIGRLEDWQRGNPQDRPASQLPGEAEAPATN
ncbi:MAG: hypothetical protein NZ561_06620 [Phycisphaerae bacterium]|nr:hypothetical protein [Phycisphaerae bacterium]